MADVSGYKAALKYCARENRFCSYDRIKELLDQTIQHMKSDKEVNFSRTAGFIVIRDGEGDLSVWVDPELGDL